MQKKFVGSSKARVGLPTGDWGHQLRYITKGAAVRGPLTLPCMSSRLTSLASAGLVLEGAQTKRKHTSPRGEAIRGQLPPHTPLGRTPPYAQRAVTPAHRSHPKHRPAQQRAGPPSKTSADTNWLAASGTGLRRRPRRGLSPRALRNLPGQNQGQVARRTRASPANEPKRKRNCQGVGAKAPGPLQTSFKASFSRLPAPWWNVTATARKR